MQDESLRTAHFSKHPADLLHIRVDETPRIKGKTIRFKAKVLGRQYQGKAGPASGYIMIYLAGHADLPAAGHASGFSRAPRYGDEWLIPASYYEVPPPDPAAAFDYKRYLARNNIFHQCYLKDREWVDLEKNTGNPLIRQAIGVRNSLTGILYEQLPGKEQAPVLSGLLLGIREDLPEDTFESFVNTGTVHLLSVSGLHVGLVYALLVFLLKPFPGITLFNKIFRLLLIVSLIWGYALITGFSPPTSRAAFMLTFYTAGQLFGKNYQGMNILAVSAFFLLLNDPFLVWDIGFQLSFLAVAGLFLLMPLISSLYRPKNGVVKAIWTWITLSVSCQLATFPLSVYYFHQFPAYFLPANVLLGFLACLILYGGLLLLAVSQVPFLAAFLAGILSVMIRVMTESMKWIGSLPGAVWGDIWISPWESLLIYLLIACMMLFFIKKQAYLLQGALVICLLLAVAALAENVRKKRQETFIVFNTGRDPVYGFISGRSAVLFHERDLKRSDFRYRVDPFLSRAGIRDLQLIRLSADHQNRFLKKEENYIRFAGKTVTLLNKEPIRPGMAADFCIIRESPYIHSGMLLSLADYVIMDGSNSFSLSNYMEKSCRENNLDFYSVKKERQSLVISIKR